MQQITDERRQIAAAAARPFGLTTWWDRVWAKQVAWTPGDVGWLREKFDRRYWTALQDPNPASGTFGEFDPAFLASHGLPDPYKAGPI